MRGRTVGRVLLVGVGAIVLGAAIFWGPHLWLLATTEAIPYEDPRTDEWGLTLLPTRGAERASPSEIVGQFRVRRGRTTPDGRTIRHGPFQLYWNEGGELFLRGRYVDGRPVCMTQYHRDGTIAAQWRQRGDRDPESILEPPWWPQ